MWHSQPFPGLLLIITTLTLIPEEAEFGHAFHLTSRFGAQSIKCEIICYREDAPSPQWMDEEPDLFSSLCTISAEFSRVAKEVRKDGPRGHYIRQDYTVVFSFRMKELKAHLTWMDKGVRQTGPAKIVYDDDFPVTVAD
ncbi:hypothetical protein OF83DRAFT_58660 [Amylostereum chailletii]|nr:hypothetical protein OF83DRAFT_58660 [Amylostereum chailletii]